MNNLQPRVGYSICAIFGCLALSLPRSLSAQVRTTEPIEWASYGHDPEGTRFSPASEIDRKNVTELRQAWSIRTGDLMAGSNAGRFEATPLFVDGTLFLSTPLGNVLALDPTTGAERWRFDANLSLDASYGDFAGRGVSTWLDLRLPRGAACRRRIFVAPVDARLIALDAATGRRCGDFGKNGEVNLTAGLRNPPLYKGEYEVTSPPAIFGDLVIVGSAVGDNVRADAPSGVVRAFDARTGSQRWTWDPIPRDSSDRAYDTWQGPAAHQTGAANAWSIISVDAKRSLIFVPVGSASPDFYGGERLGSNLFANSVVALHAGTGRIAWHFQVVHHDLWDYDIPSQPVLVTLRRNGRPLDAVAVTTKMGHVFVLDRATGVPVFPVEERRVPASDVPGERAWPTQPFPIRPAPLSPARLVAADAFGLTPEDRDQCRARIAAARSEGIFTPPSTHGTIIYPGNVGGSNWSGTAWDAGRQLLITPTNRLAFEVTLIPRDSMTAARAAFPNAETSPQRGTPYGMRREPLMSALGIPCNPPPWGVLEAVGLGDGSKRWESPIGYIPQLKNNPQSRAWGSINLGGAMITGGGLVFASGGFDSELHAYDVDNGRELWHARLPAGGNAMPMTFRAANGKQYVVIVAGGHDRLRTPLGDYVVAFSLGAGDVPSARRVASISGEYEGELRVSPNRFPVTWNLSDENGVLAGTLAAKGVNLKGAIHGSRTGDTVEFVVDFTFAEKNCGGKLESKGSVANGGDFIEGTLIVKSSCSDHDEAGTWIMRPPRRGANVSGYISQPND
jgi:quinoprotein glucose dehydrogenase